VLDQAEGYRPADPASGLLKRETTEVAFQDGRRATAWIYWLNRVPWLGTRSPSGDYAQL
jgi:gamma-glutamylcyclotransferase (GGCT)/AIG2-like uncharacterized protein YtfP